MVLKRSCRECDKLIDRSCPIFDLNRRDFGCDQGEEIAFAHPFDKGKIIKDLDWALDFWANKRPAISTKNKAKCRVCEYKGMCTSTN